MIPAKEIDGELWVKAADLPVCPTCEYNKQRAQLWRDEVYRLTGHPLPERKKEWVGLTDREMMDAIGLDDTPMESGRKIEQALKEKNA